MNRAEHRQYEEGRAEQYLSAVAVLDQHKRRGHCGVAWGGLLRRAACARDLYFSASGSK